MGGKTTARFMLSQLALDEKAAAKIRLRAIELIMMLDGELPADQLGRIAADEKEATEAPQNSQGLADLLPGNLAEIDAESSA